MAWMIFVTVMKALLVLLVVLLVLLLYLLLIPFGYEIFFSNEQDVKLRISFHSFFRCFSLSYDNLAKEKLRICIFWKWKLFPKRKSDQTSENQQEQPNKTEKRDISEYRKEHRTKKEEHAKVNHSKNEHAGKQTIASEPKKQKSLYDFVSKESNRRGIKFIVIYLLKMLRHFLPRKLEADVVFSMGEPDQTGYVLAAVSCIPFRNARIKRIEPDFESEDPYFQGYVLVSGFMQGMVVFVTLIRIFVHKECRRLLKYI
jgi:hypothetical protein